MDKHLDYFDFDASDEGLHQPGPEPQWNESLLFHLVEKDGKRALLLRIGRRVNEGHAEMTVSQLFPDGSILVDFCRDPISDNSAMTAGGLEFSAIEPLKQWRCTYNGEVRYLKNGQDLKNPKTLGSAPKLSCSINLVFKDLVPIFGAAPGGSYVNAETINKRHYEGISEVSGSVKVDGKSVNVEGFGFRDHSWGVRDWHTIDYWRWCYGQHDRNNVFTATVLQAGGGRQVNGVLIRNGTLEIVTDMQISCRYGSAPDYYLEEAKIRLPMAGGDFTATLKSQCKMPLRNRKGNETFRMVENLASVDMGHGVRPGGWVEAADRIVDGVPFGNALT